MLTAAAVAGVAGLGGGWLVFRRLIQDLPAVLAPIYDATPIYVLVYREGVWSNN